MERSPLERAVEQGDLDELVRWVDRLCERRDWDALVELRGRCRRALERGKQLWPAASLAEYRLALDAPGPWAASVLVEGTGRFALGPLPEVAASTHRWAELAPHLSPGPLAALTAHERVVRGEDLTGDDRVDPRVLELPLRLQPWEPAYPTAVYRADTADFPAPERPPTSPVALPRPGRPADDPDATHALLEVVRAWTAESNGRAEVVAVEGDALAAVAALGPPRARAAAITAADALAGLAWAGASGGAHGRRRGAARGRFDAWWALAALAGLLDEWPVPPDELGRAAAELRWWAWDAAEPATGWELRLAVDDPAHGLAWAIAAVDAA
ncbi:MAG: hypothetical protein IPM45_07010 [Acidimicrobiales bacterium]|nr:hypothetical protein [Acidimicrobiales bacterium]